MLQTACGVSARSTGALSLSLVHLKYAAHVWKCVFVCDGTFLARLGTKLAEVWV